MELIFKTVAWLFVIYMFWCLVTNQSKINRSNREALAKLNKLEAEIECDISEYKIYTTGHPYTWSEVTYDKKFDYIINSSGWDLYIPWWHKACSFVTKVDEHNKFIYIVTNREKFDWSKLQHYDQWLESNNEIENNIKKHKDS